MNNEISIDDYMILPTSPEGRVISRCVISYNQLLLCKQIDILQSKVAGKVGRVGGAGWIFRFFQSGLH